MSERSFNLGKTIVHVGLAGAWVFAIGSLVTLIFIVWARWPGTDSVSHIMGVTVDGKTVAGLGFRYSGIPGTVLAIGEALCVAAAIVMSILPGKNRIRRIGHVMLVAWSGLWLVNGVNAARLDGGILWMLLVALLVLLFVCTLFRAARGWRLTASGARRP